MPTTKRPRRSDAPPRTTWTLVLAGLGLFMAALDNLVVATALPVLKAQLHAGLASLEWTVNAYVLSFACLLMTGSALGDRFGRRRMYAVGVAIFTAASAAAALSPSVGALVAARVAQGAGAALVFPLTLTLISDAFPEEKRGGAIGVWAGIGGLAVAGGPVVGGAVINAADWHWIFWLNVPIGLAVVPLSLSRLRESFGPRPKLDVVGVALAAIAVFGLTWGMVRAAAIGWGALEVIGSMLAGVVVTIAFIAWERRTPSPVLHLGLFRSQRFVGANVATLLMHASTFGSMFMMTQFLSAGAAPLAAGDRGVAVALDRSPDADHAAGGHVRRPLWRARIHDRRARAPGDRARMGRGDRSTRDELPGVRGRAGARRSRDLAGVPGCGQRRSRLGPARGGRRRVGDEQHHA
jgi:EmrB/QacA subfamily drug resistance transporter